MLFIIIFINGIFCCFFVFYPVTKICIWSTTIWIYFMKFVIQKITQSKIKLRPFIDVSNPIWYLEKWDWKIFSITSSTLSLIMISMLSFFECITCSSMYQIFWDYLWYFFNYGLILLTYFSTGIVLFLWPLLSYSI